MENLSITLLLVSYNQEKYISAAVNGVLYQNCEPIEIIISDDHSTDNTYENILRSVEGYNGHLR